MRCISGRISGGMGSFVDDFASLSGFQEFFFVLLSCDLLMVMRWFAKFDSARNMCFV